MLFCSLLIDALAISYKDSIIRTDDGGCELIHVQEYCIRLMFAHIANVIGCVGMMQLASQMTYVSQQLATIVKHGVQSHYCCCEGRWLGGCSQHRPDPGHRSAADATHLALELGQGGVEHVGEISQGSIEYCLCMSAQSTLY